MIRNHHVHAAVLVLLLSAAGGCRNAPTNAPAANDVAPATAPVTQLAVESGGQATAVTAITATAAAAPDAAAATDAGAAQSTDEATAVTQVVSSTFRRTMDVDDPAWQDVVVRQLTTDDLATLRGQPAAPVDDPRVARGLLWVVGFRTSLPVTLADLPPDNPFDMAPDGPLDASLAGPDGLTSVYYVLGSSKELGGPTQYALLSRGVLPPDASWTLADLAAIGAAP